MYDWGVKFTNQKPSREPEYDALTTTVTVSKSINISENFSISFVETTSEIMLMLLSWDEVVVPVPLVIK